MEQTMGRENAKRNIILFVVGVLISFLGTLTSSLSDVTGVDWLSYFAFLALVGSILQIIAIILLRNVNKKYANALWGLILSFLLVLTVFILGIIAILSENPSQYDVAIGWLQIASDFAEALIVVNFVLGTNQLAEENDKGMPILTKAVVYGYMGMFVISVVFDALCLIPAIRENLVVVEAFTIVVTVLYVIRSICYLAFLIRSLWRVK